MKKTIYFVAYGATEVKAGCWRPKAHKAFSDVVYHFIGLGMYHMRFFPSREEARVFLREKSSEISGSRAEEGFRDQRNLSQERVATP